MRLRTKEKILESFASQSEVRLQLLFFRLVETHYQGQAAYGYANAHLDGNNKGQKALVIDKVVAVCLDEVEDIDG